MRATLTVRELKALLAPTVDIIARRTTIPSLSFVKLEVDGLLLRATATDLDLYLVKSAPVTGAENGAVCTPARQLYSIINKAPADDWVTLSGAKERIVIDFRDARFSLMALPADSFVDQEWAKRDASEGITFPAGWMQDKLAKAAPFISTEETRYYLNGVCMHVFDHGLALVATDGHRLGRIKCDIDVTPLLGNSRIIVPRQAVAFLIKHMKSESCARLIGEQKAIRFDAGGMSLEAKLIDGQFPDYDRVFPQGESQYTLEVCSAKLLAASRRLSAVQSTTAITFKFDGHKLVGSLRDFENNGGSIAMPGVVTGRGEPVSLKAKYLEAICRVARGNDITVKFRSAGDPVSFTDGDDLYIQMPMRADSSKFVDLPAAAVAA